MYKMTIFAVLAIATMAAGPETRPSVEAAKSAYATARNSALERLSHTPAYQAAVSQREARRAELEAARQDGTSQDKLQASAQFIKAEQAIKKLEAAALETDPEIVAAKRDFDVASAAARAEQLADKRVAEDPSRASEHVKAEQNAPAASPLNEKIVAFCVQAMGKQVGRGECCSLAEAALTDAGGINRQSFKVSPNFGDYVWGKLVCVIEKTGAADATAKDVLPGDIVQMRDGVFENGSGSHHTMIVKNFDPDTGDLNVFEQNANDRRFVTEGKYPIHGLKSGWLRVYRPVAK